MKFSVGKIINESLQQINEAGNILLKKQEPESLEDAASRITGGDIKAGKVKVPEEELKQESGIKSTEAEAENYHTNEDKRLRERAVNFQKDADAEDQEKQETEEHISRAEKEVGKDTDTTDNHTEEVAKKGKNFLDKINEDEVSESASPSNCSVRSENRDGFLEFLGNSQSGLEKILRILKNIALSLEYMAKLFANSGIRGALPPAYC
jgi:flagellar motility protein MotE (MotC chaperone)